MAARLKSILGRIHWSLLLKTAVLGFVWYFSPFWLFFLLALYFYFIPYFRPSRLWAPFIALIFFAFVEPTSFWFAVTLAALFYLVLGIKDFVFIDRRSAYELLVLVFIFLSALRFFSYFAAGYSTPAFGAALIVAFFYFIIASGLMTYERADRQTTAVLKRGRLLAAVSALVFWELSLVVLFLPLNFFFQAALLFLPTALFLEWLTDYALNELSRRGLLWNFSVFFVILIVILGSANWGI